MSNDCVILIDQRDILGFEDMRLLLWEHGIKLQPTTLSMRLTREREASENRRPGDLPRPFKRVSNETSPLFDRRVVMSWIASEKSGESL
jgi:hypothetical protein